MTTTRVRGGDIGALGGRGVRDGHGVSRGSVPRGPRCWPSCRAAGSAGAAGHRGGGVPVEHHGVVRVADQDLGTRFGARLGEGLLDAQAGQPVRQVADGLVVAEVGLLDPAPRLLAHDEEAVAEPDHLEAGLVGGLHLDPEAPARRAARPGGRPGPPRPARPSRSPARAVPRRWRRRSRRPGQPRASRSGLRQVGHFPGGRDVDLVERDDPWPVGQFGAGGVAVGGEFRLDHVQVGDRVAARLLGARSRARGPAPRSAPRAAGSPGPGPCPGWRPGSGPARRLRRTGRRRPRPRPGAGSSVVNG